MKLLLVVFVTVHLVADLALPSLPGAFRFNPDESAAGVRGNPLQPRDIAVALQASWSHEATGVLRPDVTMLSGLERPAHVAARPVFIPHRNPSSDPPLPGGTEDH